VGPLMAGTSMLRIEVTSSVSRKMTVDIPVELEGTANEDKNGKKDTGNGSGMVMTVVVVVEGCSGGGGGGGL